MKDKDNTKLKNNIKLPKKWEKIFVISNIVIIIGLLIFYGYRTIYYYKLTNGKPTDNKLFTYIMKKEKIMYSDSGLYQDINDNDFYFYKGDNVNNYVYYAGRIYRIVSISKDNFKLIADQSETSLVSSYNETYSNSYINKWLNNNYINSIKDSDNYLINSAWCDDIVNIDKLTCENTINNKVGLLTINEYLKSGGSEGYLNNHTYWWTMNGSKDNKTWYIFPDGGVNDESYNDVTFYSYGVRPVITLNKNIPHFKGTGNIDDPYYISESNQVLLKDNNIGNYIKYNNYLWRIAETNDNYVKLTMNDVISSEDNKIYKSNYNNISNYLNNTFIKEFKAEDLIKCDYYSGLYNSSNKYDYTKINIKTNSYFGISNIGDFFIDTTNNYWLNTKLNSNKNLIYTMTENNSTFADLSNNTNAIKPSVCIKPDKLVISGNGSITDPLLMEE